MRRAVRSAAAVLVLLLLLLVVSAPRPAAATPSLVLRQAEARPGAQIVVEIDGFVSPAVTLTVCGNLARRGSVDCDLMHGIGIGLGRPGPTLADLLVTVPPSPCPCVVRATSPSGVEVTAAALAITGAPTATLVEAPGIRPTVAVDLEVRRTAGGLMAAVREALGGRLHRDAVITVRNVSGGPVTGLSLVGAVGRSARDGQPFRPTTLAPLNPGETRTYTIATSVPAPTFGTYLWDVGVHGGGPAVEAQKAQDVHPSLLILLGVGLVIDLATFAVIRGRRHLREQQPAGPVRVGEVAA